MRGGCAGGSVGGGDPSRRPLRGAERCAAVDCAEGINTSAEGINTSADGGIVVEYSSDETSAP